MPFVTGVTGVTRAIRVTRVIAVTRVIKVTGVTRVTRDNNGRELRLRAPSTTKTLHGTVQKTLQGPPRHAR